MLGCSRVSGGDKFLFSLNGRVELGALCFLLGMQIGGFALQTCGPAVDARNLRCCRRYRIAKRRELTAHFGGATGCGGLGALLPLGRKCEFECGAVLGKALLGLDQQLLFGGQRKDLAVDVGELIAELANFGTHCGNNVAVDRGLTLPGDSAESFVDQVLGTIRALAEAFEAGQGVAEVDCTLCGKIAFETNDFGIEA